MNSDISKDSPDNHKQVDISVIIVNYNVKHFAEQCLRSIYAAQNDLNVEILLVDNNSDDGSVDYLKKRFSEVDYTANTINLGFGRANNQALKRSSGRFLLVLNPDTVLSKDSLTSLVTYMETHPEVGAIGPKILNRYGSFDITSKRGLPTPWVAFCRISGMATLFPKSKIFGKYDLLYLNPDKPANVDALAGCCMVVRREAYEQVGGFDEDFFMYGEDIDWTYRIAQAGWETHYAPVTKIVHFKGESTRRSTINRDRAFYGAMHMFVDKHFKHQYSFLSHHLINLGIFVAWALSRIKSVLNKIIWQSVDLIGLWTILVMARWVRTFDFWADLGFVQWGKFGLNRVITVALLLQSATWVASLAGFGAYGKRRGQYSALLMGLTLGFLINTSFTYFFRQFAFSRFAILYGLLIGGLFVIGWRAVLNWLSNSKQWHSYLQRRSLIIGIGRNGREIWKRLKSDQSSIYSAVGFIDPEELSVGLIIDDLPVLGGETDLIRLIHQEEIEEILFAYDAFDYDHVLEVISKIGVLKNIAFKLITTDSLSKTDNNIPFLSVEYMTPRGLGGAVRRISTLVLRK